MNHHGMTRMTRMLRCMTRIFKFKKAVTPVTVTVYYDDHLMISMTYDSEAPSHSG